VFFLPFFSLDGFKGFCSVFVTAAFAFSGTELVGLAAAETANPRKILPTATKQVFWRVVRVDPFTEETLWELINVCVINLCSFFFKTDVLLHRLVASRRFPRTIQ